MTIKRKSELPDLASQLEGLFGRKNWNTLWQTFTLSKNWGEVAGKEIAERSKPAYIQKNILWVYVCNSIWMHHMQTVKPQLVERVQQFLPELEILDIRWIMQPAEEWKADQQTGEQEECLPDPEQTQAFERITSVIENKECRAALCKLWLTYHKFK